MTRDDLGDRMKDYYESRSKTRLIRRMPVIIRLDGKAFHTFTKGFEKPFDMVRAMQETMKYLCENIQGCVLGYTQSDEITLVLIDYQNLNSDAWFDYEVQKLCSVSASMATFAFNRNFARLAALEPEKKTKQTNAYAEVASKGAFFDARCFNIPKEEVTNCLLWRQQDATRNSIHMTGRAYFSHKQIEGKEYSAIGNFCADAGMVCALSMNEVIKYNSEFPKWIETHPWCVTVVSGFDGVIDYYVDSNEEAHIYGIGNVNFYTTQTGF